jgi:hypothetical protein
MIMLSNKIFGAEWSDKIKAFWFGTLDSEYIAWKGSHQVFVYPIDQHPAPPAKVIQFTRRIETIQDFEEALQQGVRYEVQYSQIKENEEAHV